MPLRLPPTPNEQRELIASEELRRLRELAVERKAASPRLFLKRTSVTPDRGSSFRSPCGAPSRLLPLALNTL